MPDSVTVRVPATSANLGPGFDCLGLALDLWNEVEVRLGGPEWRVSVSGEGAGRLPDGDQNLIAAALRRYFRAHGLEAPRGGSIACRNRVPCGSGLGSSATAAVAGLLAGAALTGPVDMESLLPLAAELEGHADNAAAALLGGLCVSLHTPAGWTVRRFDTPALRAALVLPDFDLPTRAARRALPDRVAHADAVFNLGRSVLVVEALRGGDLTLLRAVMDDRLHQPYRLELIPGARAALEAARACGAAVALSGAGPSLIAFCEGDPLDPARAMQAAFSAAGLTSRTWTLAASNRGAHLL